MAAHTSSTNVPATAHDQYMREVKQLQTVTLDEEQRLLDQIADGGKNASDARTRLIEGYQPVVIALAKRQIWGCRFLTLLDLIQEGNVGLLRALNRYEPAKCKAAFGVWAVWWIRCAIRTACWQYERGVHISRQAARMLREMKTVAEQLAVHLGHEPSVEDLAAAIGITSDEAQDLLRLQKLQVISLHNVDVEDIAADEVLPLLDGDNLDDDTDSPIRRLVAQLPANMRRVIELRYGFVDGTERTPQEVADELGIKRATVDALDRQGRLRLRLALEGHQPTAA